MMMFLSILCAGVVVLAVLVAMLSTAEITDQATVELEIPVQPAKFFAASELRRRAGDDLAIDLLVAQIERHVRLEQAAAEGFLEMPTPESLHSGAGAPLPN